MKYLPFVTALLCAVLAVPATAATAAESGSADPVEVRFPSVTEFNPEHLAYEVEIHDPQPELGELVATWGERTVALPHEGLATIPFTAADGSSPVLNVLRCPADGSACTGTGHWQSLHLVTQFRFELDGGSGVLGTASGVPIDTVWPAFDDGDVMHLAWTLTDRAGALVVSGAGDWVVGQRTPALGIPAGSQAGSVHLNVRATTDSARLGRLEAVAENDYFLDVRPPALVTRISSDVVFPARDGYLDAIDVTVKRSYELSSVVMDVVDRAGTVTEFHRDWGGGGNTVLFRGLDRRERLPAGLYTLRVTGYDEIGNAAQDTYPIRIDDRRRVERTFRRTMPAARTVADKYVGACSRLGPAAGRGWRGSLGLYSKTPCAKANGSVVMTINGVRVPPSVGGYPGDVEMSLYGGAARGARSAYLVHSWFRAGEDKLVQRREFAGRLGTHRAYGVPADDVVRASGARRWVYWHVGLTDGSRYDVKSYTISMGYYELVAPRSRTASDANTIADPSGAPGPG